MTRTTPSQDIDPSLPLFARRLKAARLQAGISQEKLGVDAGVDEFSASARINQYERGKHAPDTLMATHLARVLGVPLSYFWAVDEDEAALLCAFGRLGAKKRKTLLRAAEELGLGS